MKNEAARGMKIALAIACMAAALSATAAQTRNVLLLYSNNRLLPANVEIERGMREVFAATKDRNIDVYAEFLDQPAFGGPAYDQTIHTYLREKYAARPPEVVIVSAEYALDFMLQRRAELFRGVPIIHIAVGVGHLKSSPPLPADVVGAPVDYDPPGTIEMALRLHPDTRRLLVVTGTTDWDRARESAMRTVVAQLGTQLSVEFVTGLKVAALEQRLGELGPGDLIYTPGFFRDGDGRLFSPRDAAALVAAASRAPVYGPYSTFIGTGVVGGRMPDYLTMGRDAGRVVNKLLDGTPPEKLVVPAAVPMPVQIDWRQVRRWGIDADAIPRDATVHFKEPTFWEEHRNKVITIAAVILLQAALIAALLVERRLRRRTAVALEANRSALTRLTRVSMMGQLSASIAHQLNQPLAAILGNAEAARKMLEREHLDVAELKEICDDIITEDQRAAEVIRRLGALYKRGEMTMKPFDLNELVRETLGLAGTDLANRHVVAVTDLASLPPIDGGRIQLQQVLLNLILNAADSMGDVPVAERSLTIRTELDGEHVRMSVIDVGTGIATENIAQVFDAFWTTKVGGMGIGLAICQSIVAAHRGVLTVANNPGRGATFHARWPIRQQA